MTMIWYSLPGQHMGI